MMMMNSIKATSHQVCCIVAKFLGYAVLYMGLLIVV